jgi:hypothetical protein
MYGNGLYRQSLFPLYFGKLGPQRIRMGRGWYGGASLVSYLFLFICHQLINNKLAGDKRSTCLCVCALPVEDMGARYEGDDYYGDMHMQVRICTYTKVISQFRFIFHSSLLFFINNGGQWHRVEPRSSRFLSPAKSIIS